MEPVEEFALESIKLPFILSGVCSPSEANYCSNPFEVFFIEFKMKIIEFAKYKKVFLEKKWIPIVIFITFFLKNLINLQGAYFEEQ